MTDDHVVSHAIQAVTANRHDQMAISIFHMTYLAYSQRMLLTDTKLLTDISGNPQILD